MVRDSVLFCEDDVLRVGLRGGRFVISGRRRRVRIARRHLLPEIRPVHPDEPGVRNGAYSFHVVAAARPEKCPATGLGSTADRRVSIGPAIRDAGTRQHLGGQKGQRK